MDGSDEIAMQASQCPGLVERYMLNHRYGSAMAWTLVAFALVGSVATTETGLISPGQDWLDTSGKRIDAHSGRVLWDPPSQRFHWHGMSAVGPVAESDESEAGQTDQIDEHEFYIVNCYSSADLLSWRFEGVALNTSHYVSRPKVLVHPDGRYVLWMKSTPNVLVAEATSPAGPFTLLSQPFTLFGAEIGGATAYADPAAPSDGFFIYSQKPGPTNNHTRMMTVAQLTADWRNVSVVTAAFPGHLEGPAMFFNQREGLYYMWTSHTHGWDGSPAVVHSSSSLAGPVWIELPYNPTHSPTSWQSQSSDILTIPNPNPLVGSQSASTSLHIYVADRFVPYVNDGSSGGSRPVWLPVCVEPGPSNFSVPWFDDWNPAAPPCAVL